jgi:hypothetical protein
MLNGDFWRDIVKDEGILYENFRAACGQDVKHWVQWRKVEQAKQANIAADIEGTGAILLKTARAELPAIEETGDNGRGPTSRTSYQRAATTAAAGAALLMPAIHGKGAGRQAPITVNANNAAFFGGAAPAGTLDDWTPEGLTP